MALSSKGAIVFTPAYQGIMLQTPLLRPNSSAALSVAFAILFAVLVVGGFVLVISAYGAQRSREAGFSGLWENRTK